MPTFTGTQSDDVLTGTEFADEMYGLGGNDTLNGLGGNDTLDGGDGNDTLNGGDGFNTLNGGDGIDNLFGRGIVDGGSGYDYWTADYSATASGLSFTFGQAIEISDGTRAVNVEHVMIRAGSGNDVFNVSSASIAGIVDAGGGLDTFVYQSPGDGLVTSFGAYSNGLIVSAWIGHESNVSFQNLERVEIRGSDLDEIFRISGGPFPAGALVLNGGGGFDVLEARFDGAGNSINFVVNGDGTVTSNQGQFTGFERYSINGGEASDTIRGGAGDDSLWGSNGNDLLYGGAGADFLYGESGADTLTGGDGRDTFVGAIPELNGDTITDFGRGDRIVFTNLVIGAFSFSLSGNTLTFTGGSLTLQGVPGHLIASENENGHAQLMLSDTRNDFNGDGRSDILWRNSNGTITNWLANGNGTFASNHVVATYALDPSFTVLGTGDFNGDGRDDLLLRHANGTVTDWLGQANGGFVSNHVAATYSLGTNWTLAGTADFNGDGRDDILWRNEVGALSQWLGQANGGFAWNPNAGYQLPTNWRAAATGDFNGDGRDDIIWRNEVGALSQWLGQSDGSYVYNGNAAYQLPTNWTLAAAGDFNGDGRDDILWRNEVGAMSQWLANADGAFAYNANAAYQLPINWQLAAVGDFNGDGRDDLIWRNEVGAMAQWLASSDGSFAYNANAAYQLATNWQMQPNPMM